MDHNEKCTTSGEFKQSLLEFLPFSAYFTIHALQSRGAKSFQE